jgi:ribonuclease HI
VLAASGFGGLLGSVAASRLLTRVGYSWIKLQALTWCGGFLVLAMSAGRQFLLLAIVMAILGLSGALGNIEVDVYLMKHVKPDMLARVTSISRLTSLSGCAVGPAVGGILAQELGIPLALFCLFAISSLLVLASFVMPRAWTPRDQPAIAGSRVLLGPPKDPGVTPRMVVETRVAVLGNPGAASYAAVLTDAQSGKKAMEVSAALGESTRNAAEYRGVIAGLMAASQIGSGEPVEIRLTSEAVIFQMIGKRVVKNPGFRQLRDEARRIAETFPAAVFTKIPMDDTAHVYELAVKALGPDPHDAQPAEQDRPATAVSRVATSQEAPARRSMAKAGTGGVAPRRLARVDRVRLGAQHVGCRDQS